VHWTTSNNKLVFINKNMKAKPTRYIEDANDLTGFKNPSTSAKQGKLQDSEKQQKGSEKMGRIPSGLGLKMQLG
jgi:hypothetical protein